MADNIDAQVAGLRQKLVEIARHMISKVRRPLPLDVSDLVQDVFLSARFEELLRRYGEEDVIRSLVVVLKHHLSHAIRDAAALKRNRVHECQLDVTHVSTLRDRNPAPEDLASGREWLARLADAVPDLPPSQAEVIRSYFLRGESLSGIATRLGRSRATITVRFRDGLAKLKERFQLTDEG